MFDRTGVKSQNAAANGRRGGERAVTPPRSTPLEPVQSKKTGKFTAITGGLAGVASGASRARSRAEAIAAGQAKLEAHLDDAIAALVKVLDSDSHAAAVRAASLIIERALGRPGIERPRLRMAQRVPSRSRRQLQ